MSQTQVTIQTRNVGQNFGCVGVVRYASNGRKVHETDARPYGYDSAAYHAAKAWAEDKGYIVIEAKDE